MLLFIQHICVLFTTLTNKTKTPILSIGERLSYFIEKHLNISVREFEKSIKAPQGSIQRGINGSNIGVDKLQKTMTRYKELNANWLLSGQGIMLTDDYTDSSFSAEPAPSLTKAKADNSIANLSQSILNLSEDALVRSNAEKLRSEAELIRAENERKLVNLLEAAVKNL